MSKITYKRLSGNEITVADNEANREHAKSAGWVEVKPKPKAKAKPKSKPK